MPITGKRTNGSSGASFVDGSSPRMDSTSRKIRKPLMERKRRARINHSLDELHHLLTQTEFTSKGAKLEKADILEMTVQYLKQLSHNDSSSRETADNLHNALLERYLLGFERCAREMERLLADSPDLEAPLRHSILSHLQRSLDRLRTEQEEAWVGRRFGSCSLLFGEPRDVRTVPSKLGAGEVVLLLSSKGVKCEEDLKKGGTVWRPWW